MKINLILMLCLMAFSLSASFVHAQGKSYPLEARRAFLQSCVGHSKELIPYCRCMLESFEKKVSAADFAKIAQQPDGGEAHMKIIADYCIKKHHR